MATTLSLSSTLTGQHGAHDNLTLGGDSVTLTTTRPLFVNAGSASTSYGALDYASISAPLLVEVINDDATDNLVVSLNSGTTDHLTIPAGHSVRLHLPGNNIQVKASAGTVPYTYAIAK